jgi:hypothetical protein
MVSFVKTFTTPRTTTPCETNYEYTHADWAQTRLTAYDNY